VSVAKCMSHRAEGLLRLGRKNTRNIHLDQPEKWQNINFSGTLLLDRISGYVDHLVKEEHEIQLNTNNCNKGNIYILSWSWCPVTSILINKQDQALS
jgi:hypothetical protein